MAPILCEERSFVFEDSYFSTLRLLSFLSSGFALVYDELGFEKAFSV